MNAEKGLNAEPYNSLIDVVMIIVTILKQQTPLAKLLRSRKQLLPLIRLAFMAEGKASDRSDFIM